MSKKDIVVCGALFLFIILTRLLPHLPNFVPVVAVALAAGVYLQKKWAILLPISAMLVSDLFVGFYDWRLMLAVYGSFVMIGIFSLWLKKNKSTINILSAAVLASIFFFLVTNFSVWIFSSWYANDINGLMLSYFLALPFFRASLLGNIFYSAVIFSCLEVVYNYSLFKVQTTKVVGIFIKKLI